MINIALCLIHNHSTAANRNQITALMNVRQVNLVDVLDADGNPVTDPVSGDPVQFMRYTVIGLSIPHEVGFYQIVPFGVSLPNNLYDLDSHKVFYGAGDENKTSTHQRFRNWPIKRACDYGADIVALVTDHAQFTAAGLEFQINRLIDRRVLVVPLWGLAVSNRLFREVGQFREDLSASASLDDLRARILAAGLESD